jgi:hypothetical protein
LWLGFMMGISPLSRLLVSALVVAALVFASRCERMAESLWLS